jgi:hypothetical protein
MVKNNNTKEKIQKYWKKKTVSSENQVEIMIFSPLEKGVMILPILIHIVIPKR